ncbi:MAG: hypothetical protein IJY90_01505 [Clostridia bacterium]|nr:hypothetical protein [Clostridia bacterium]
MKTIITIFQELLKFALFFVISYIWLNYSFDSKGFALALSIAISILLEVLSFIFSRNKKAKKHLKSSQQSDAENMFLSLVLDKSAMQFFYNLFNTRHKNVKIASDHLVIEQQNGQAIIFYPFLKITQLEVDDVISITKLHPNAEKIIISCNIVSPQCNKYSGHFKQNVVIMNKYDTYLNLYQEYDYYPKITKEKPLKKSFNAFTKGVFNKTKTKNYILAGLVLLLSSLYAPYSLYYKITASVLLLLGLICLILPNRQIKKELV